MKGINDFKDRIKKEVVPAGKHVALYHMATEHKHNGNAFGNANRGISIFQFCSKSLLVRRQPY